MVNVRWTDARDHVAIAALDRWWDEREVQETSVRRDVWGFVAEDTVHWEVVGYVFCEVDNRHAKIIRLFAKDGFRTKAWTLLDAVKSRLGKGVQRGLRAELSEWDTEGHLLLRDLGFVARQVVRDAYDGEDLYRFELSGK